jgi:hypothetical protein
MEEQMSKATNINFDPAVTAVIPGSRVPHRFTVLRTADGKLKFRSDRTIGIYDPKRNKCFYSSRGKSEMHLRQRARVVELTPDIVKAFDSVAKLSDNARRKLTGV